MIGMSLMLTKYYLYVTMRNSLRSVWKFYTKEITMIVKYGRSRSNMLKTIMSTTYQNCIDGSIRSVMQKDSSTTYHILAEIFGISTSLA